MSAAEALDVGQQIIELIEDELPFEKYMKAQEFFEDVLEKTRSIMRTVEKAEKATAKQIQALDNMKNGVERWLF